MKKILLTAGLFGFTVTVSYAQNTTGKMQSEKTDRAGCIKGAHINEAKCQDTVNYMNESTYLGYYPETNVYLRPPFVPLRPVVVPYINGACNDPDYYLNLNSEGGCR